MTLSNRPTHILSVDKHAAEEVRGHGCQHQPRALRVAGGIHRQGFKSACGQRSSVVMAELHCGGVKRTTFCRPQSVTLQGVAASLEAATDLNRRRQLTALQHQGASPTALASMTSASGMTIVKSCNSCCTT